MAYDGLLAGAVAAELKQLLPGSKIEKVTQPETDQIVLHIRTAESRVKLLLDISSQGSRVQLTNNDFENPKDAPAFCMLLRKHIGGGRITDVYQVENERIIILEIETVNEMNYSVNKRLIAETMGKYSNIIVTDATNDRIIDSAKRVSIDVNRYRQILPGLTYVQPPKGNLANNLGYGPSTRIAVEEGADPKRCVPTVWLDENGAVKDVHVIDLRQYRGSYEERTFEDITSALDFYYNKKFETNRVSQKAADFQRQVGALIEKRQLKKAKLLEEIKKSEESDIYRIKGELINANIDKIIAGAKKVELVNYYDGQPMIVELDEKLSPARNAQAYYKKYAKLKASKKEKLAQLSECESETEYLLSVSGQISISESYAELDTIKEELYSQGFIRIREAAKRKVKTKPSPRKLSISSGLTVLVGRNNIENDYITFKLSQKGDLWFHTKDIHGSHVLLQTGGTELSPEDIYETAAIAAYYSKGRDSENVPVDYVPIRYVKKPAGARPGMVIFTNNKTVWIDPKLPEDKK